MLRWRSDVFILVDWMKRPRLCKHLYLLPVNRNGCWWDSESLCSDLFDVLSMSMSVTQ